ncbi:MAG: CoA-binding protein [Bacteroidales bacterium]|nr:CoA-binding protein [Bacteroidales bacterium]
MTTKTSIQEFVSKKNIAIAGVSRDQKKFGNIVYCELKKRGYKCYPVNPNTDEINGEKCYRGMSNLPEEAESILILTNSAQTDALIEEAIAKGIKNIWIQQKSHTKETEKFMENNSINLISNQCILMFAEPVTGFHKFHRFIKGLFGGLPK